MGEIPWQRDSGRAGPPAPRCGRVKFDVEVSMMGADGETVGEGMMAVRKVDIEVADVDIDRERARRVVVVGRCIVVGDGVDIGLIFDLGNAGEWWWE